HMQFLGSTLPSIALEKAGIIKQGIPVVIGESNQDTDTVFLSKAIHAGSEIIFADKKLSAEVTEKNGFIELSYAEYGNKLISPLTGDYQVKNVTTVLACSQLPEFRQPLSSTTNTEELVYNGLKNTIINTGFKGRWQKLSREPLIVCDIGHNTHGLKYVVE